ncbi:isoprenyl transferase [Mumia sp. zg.B53]|uniref:isoprenyl transferase n=2 Tax=Mumia TaxID=1546255 RepID=UPI001C6E9210|nr:MULTISPECIES: isoprenyl transferase [unclassified Mumia]MBW9206867.1 isoprenyl transferase [Mumia sp. zg.B17]MBW9210846.1 isoprenyl transferase [Mumia sp. zg.B21]MBW9215411.1 isoprenyl transferase [Mumia sp. zg.B53]
MSVRDLLYTAYERRLLGRLRPDQVPAHVGVIVDGNRRWARGAGGDVSSGYQAGADKIVDFLGWCDDLEVKVVTLWLLSTENLLRPEPEVRALLAVIANLVDQLTASRRWHVRLIGNLDLLPPDIARSLQDTVASTSDVDGMEVNLCVGYGGRQELADAVRSLLREQSEQGRTIDQVAEVLDVEHIADHLYTKGQPDPDLVIRTSGEQRLSGFLLWQSVHSEFYFCEALWPAFRRVDFLRAIRSYAERERRFGQ